MKHIQVDHIEKATQWIDNVDDEQFEAAISALSEKQPILLDYVLAAPSEYENDALEGYLLYYYWVINESYVHAGIPTTMVTEEMIEAFEQPFEDMLEDYFGAEDDDQATERMEEFCDQPELLKFMSIEVSTEDEDGTSMDDETATQLYITCAAMIALLNESAKVTV
ncbi:MAG: hypothetical protein EBS17_07885 [Flavobacteriia bacterium]|jgi:hypothetical protein|nr:hypothetical protein [Flavobacteriia bacterium]